MAEEKKKYNFMEPVLNKINGSFVSLSEEDKRRNNSILLALIKLITDKMKEKDNLFKEMYTRVFFGGSYYDGLRVGQPNEFDLDLLLSLPKIVEPTITTSNKPGFVHLQFKEYAKFLKQLDLVKRYKGLDKLINEKHFLDTSKVLSWMESVVTLALNSFQKQDNWYILRTDMGLFQGKICKGGPAFTLKVRGTANGRHIDMDIDLVPCFSFGKEKWPVNGFRSNPVQKKPDFFIVPKPLKDERNSVVYWRLSFQEQERELIDGKRTLKPTVKLLKKMRDNLDHRCIASYYIKTIILWETEKRGEEFWNNSLSYVFMNVLIGYYVYLSNGKIPYFWNSKNDLIKNIKRDTVTNLSNRIKAIIDDIEKHPKDPFVVAKYLLTRAELQKITEQVTGTIATTDTTVTTVSENSNSATSCNVM